MFYFKLATSNLKKNKSVYSPFILSMSFLVIMNVIMQVLLENKGMSSLPSAASARAMFGFGSIIIMIFTVIFSIYTNSFLLKQRKKELGLYNILGLGKKELTRVLAWETLTSYFLTLIIGLTTGTIFARLCFLILKKMINVTNEFSYEFSIKSYLTIIVFFSIVFFLLFLINSFQVRRVNPMELLRGSQHGEKEPKANWIMAIIGIGCIVTGYTISVMITTPLAALSRFFIAVILVIIGTYGLFMSSSIVILKLLKRNKKFYYQPNHFISVSSMMYRMKQNAAGLASIAILCTMVLVTLSTTASLYFGSEDILKNRNPYNLSVITNQDIEQHKEKFVEIAKNNDVKTTEINQLTFATELMVLKKEGKYTLVDTTKVDADDFKDTELFLVMTEAEFGRLTGASLNLKADSVALYSMGKPYAGKEIRFENQDYFVQKKLDKVSFMPASEGLINQYLMVMKSEEVQKLITNLKMEDIHKNTTIFMNFEGSEKKKIKVAYDIKEYLNQSTDGYTFSSLDLDRKEMSLFIGGFLFLGLIFGLTFTIATGLIIYYKQISEGYQDQERFNIMQRVGMSHDEVRKIIHGQILMVFFFPIILATLHLSFSFPIIRKLLLLFGLGNGQLLLVVSAITVVIFMLIYLFMYWQTSKIYYKLVERD